MGIWAWHYSFKGGVATANFGWVYPHPADCVLIYQVYVTAAIHEDSCKLESVDYRIQYQGSPPCVPDIFEIVLMVEGDWF